MPAYLSRLEARLLLVATFRRNKRNDATAVFFLRAGVEEWRCSYDSSLSHLLPVDTMMCRFFGADSRRRKKKRFCTAELNERTGMGVSEGEGLLTSSSGDAEDGESWNSAFESIQQGINQAYCTIHRVSRLSLSRNEPPWRCDASVYPGHASREHNCQDQSHRGKRPEGENGVIPLVVPADTLH